MKAIGRTYVKAFWDLNIAVSWKGISRKVRKRLTGEMYHVGRELADASGYNFLTLQHIVLACMAMDENRESSYHELLNTLGITIVDEEKSPCRCSLW